MRRLLAYLLTLGLVPVLVVTAGPTPSAMATGYGTSVSATFSWDTWKPGQYGNCQFSGYLASGGADLTAWVGVACATGWNSALGKILWSVSGGDADGDLCESPAVGWQGDLGGNSFEPMDSPVTTDGTLAECNVDELCVFVESHDGGGPGGPDVLVDWECTSFPLGQMPGGGVGGTCEYGTVGTPYQSLPLDSMTWHEGTEQAINYPVHVALQPPEYGPRWGIDWRSQWTAEVEQEGGPGTWFFYLVTDMAWNSGQYGSTFGNWVNGGEVGLAGSHWSLPVGVDSFSMFVGQSVAAGGYPYHENVSGPTGEVIGAGLYYSTTGSNAYGTYPGRTGPIGMTDPGACQFYWGEKIAESPDERDEPIGGLGSGGGGGSSEPPPVDPQPDDVGGCSFSLTDPGSWLEGGMCAAVGLLKGIFQVLQAILAAFGNLAAAIASAIADALAGIVGEIGDLLEALFVPDREDLADSIADVKDAWADTAPGELLGTVVSIPGKFSVPADVGCDGVAMPIKLAFGEAENPLVLHPFSTCRPGLSAAASMVRVGLQVVVWVSGLLLAFRLLASSLGYQVALGGGRDES